MMKVRWRQHEMIMIVIIVIAQIVTLPITINTNHLSEVQGYYQTVFKQNDIPFNYWVNVVLPRICSILLLFTAYLLINQFTPWWFNRKTKEGRNRNGTSIIVLKAGLILFSVSYFLAIGINVISFYARPHLFNYGGYQILSLTGYNDQPLNNLLFGFDRALLLVSLVTAIVLLRDYIIRLIERPGTKREFRVMIINNAIPLLILYIIIPFIFNPAHSDFLRYLVFITPLPILYLYLTFWLFPFKGDRTFLYSPFLLRLLSCTFICAIPAIFLFWGNPKAFLSIVYWLLLVFIASPVVWIFYQLRKDRILQLKSIETALAATDANLQGLKSQINPHFLFNALNTLYGTALKGDTEKTAEGIQKLGDMMRFMLHENILDHITMEKEIEYLTNYISLQKLRVQSSPEIIVEDYIEESPAGRQIAPMLLIPFVENAFKHGISSKEKSWIKIELIFDNAEMHFEVINSVHPNEKKTDFGKSGIGLANVKERLKLQYRDKYVLKISETESEFTVKLTLPC